MKSALQRYGRWLHGQWPAGTVERLPAVNEDGSTNVAGIYVVGDLTGIPLLKFSADTGARVIHTILADADFQKRKGQSGVRDVVIIGGGVSGMAAALEARERGLDYVLLEAAEPFSTIANFPKGKPIYTYPTDMEPAGQMKFEADVKEALMDELHAQTTDRGIETTTGRAQQVTRKGGELHVELADGEPLRCLRVVVAIGRSGNFRKLGVPGEELDKVSNRLHDPKDYCDQDVVVVGGGDSALETAIALAQCGSRVTLSYRKPEFSRAKPENIEKVEALIANPAADVDLSQPVSERVTTAAGSFLGEGRKPGQIDAALATNVKEITADSVTISGPEGDRTVPNDAVFAMIGREPPLDFFRRSGIRIRGETRGIEWLGVALFFLACWFVYDWKNEGLVSSSIATLSADDSFPKAIPTWLASLGDWWNAQIADRSTMLGTIAVSMKGRSFYYTLAYSLLVVTFGVRRIRRRKTPYVKLQTTTLMLVQVFPLFLLPELFLPWMGYNGWFDAGAGAWFADQFFELYISTEQWLAQQWPDWGHPRAYWRAYGFVLAWPLMVYNWFTQSPMLGWLILGAVQTFVLIPLMVRKWGKGAYCGWICSCGGLAETAGDTLRDRMPHGPKANRLNFVGQILLAAAFILLFLRILGWIFPGSFFDKMFAIFFEGKISGSDHVNPISWKWTVDVFLAGVVGVGLYIKYSGRVWCRFACPLAALMHIYARFTRFRIFADKKKCISCNVCTSVCHQGIDIMNFANKGLPMEDPECVRCSACVQGCPTGVLQFGEIDRQTGEVAKLDSLAASPALMAEKQSAN